MAQTPAPAMRTVFFLVLCCAGAEAAADEEWDDPKPAAMLGSEAAHAYRPPPAPPLVSPIPDAPAIAAAPWIPPAAASPASAVLAIETRPAEPAASRPLDLSTRSAPAAAMRPTAAPGSSFSFEETETVSARKGSLSAVALKGAVRPHLGEVKYCFQRAQQNAADLEGRVFIRFMVSPAGLVTSSEVESTTLDNPAAEQCLVSAVKRWVFPRPVGNAGVSVVYPFNLITLE